MRRVADFFLSQEVLNRLYDKAYEFNSHGNNPKLQDFIEKMGICPKPTMENGIIHDAPMSLGRVLERAFFISCGCCLFVRGVFVGGIVSAVMFFIVLIILWSLN